MNNTRNSIEIYTDAACLIARDKLKMFIFDRDRMDLSATMVMAINRLAEAFPDRDMGAELAMPEAHREAHEQYRAQRRRLATDLDLIIDTLNRDVGSCGLYYELWHPRMMQAIAGHIRRYSVDKAVAAALWATVDCPADGPTEQDWKNASEMESDVWETIQEDME
ncbi:hypothetical protein B1757_02700 [Acidithiobacillus marinus]|uniref:Uncharacterized protein n=1 Tax=Acidithiobacillus marinus TaxID=187490 RepID=A0A2I1DPC3_9PROT|nr:hypothetical protein [Acidithiobacillus marinus]PKY11716.1 hypothetical protein B1757_02700 [Acidithiobacillus marinus]